MNKTSNSVPIFFIGAGPDQPVRLKNFFESGNSSVKKTLQEPDNIRRMGWNMETLDTPKLFPGGYWLVKNGERKVIRFYKDGSLVVRAYASEDFLGWGTNKDGDENHQYLNPLALIEFVLEFTRSYQKLTESVEGDIKYINYKFGFKNTSEGARKLQMHQGLFKTRDYFISGDFSEEFSGLVEKGQFSPGEHAFEIIKIIFVHFGLEETNIKFRTVNETSGKTEISADLIKEVN
jgi:hypothetical protein